MSRTTLGGAIPALTRGSESDKRTDSMLMGISLFPSVGPELAGRSRAREAKELLPFEDLEEGFHIGQATYHSEDPGKSGSWQNSGWPGRDSARAMRRAVFKYHAKIVDGRSWAFCHGRPAIASRSQRFPGS